MNKYILLCLMLLNACVGKIQEPNVVIYKGAYKLELNNIYKEENPNAEYNKYKIISSKDTYEVKIDSIAYDLIIDFKLSKLSKTNNTFFSSNKFNLLVKNKHGLAFDIRYTDCNKPVEQDSYCNIIFVAKYQDGKDVTLGENDYLDLVLTEEITTSYEEAVSFNISLDVHRKQKSTVEFITLPDEVNFGTGINYFLAVNKNQFIKFKIDGELEYNILTQLTHSIHSNAFNLNCFKISEAREHYCNISFKELSASGFDFFAYPAILNLAIKFENENLAKDINTKNINLKGLRKTAPNLSIIPEDFYFDEINYQKSFLVKNTGESTLTLENCQIIATNYPNTLFIIQNQTDCVNKILNFNDNFNLDIIFNTSIAETGVSYTGGKIVFNTTEHNNILSKQIDLKGGINTPANLYLKKSTIDYNNNSSFNFSSTLIGKTSDVITFNIVKDGSNNASLISYHTTGAFIKNILGTNCTTSITNTSACKVELYFTPTTSGLNQGSFTINYFDGISNQTYTLYLSGTGINKADIKFYSDSSCTNEINIVNFENVIINYEKIKSIYIKNIGEYDATNVSISNLTTPFSYIDGLDNIYIKQVCNNNPVRFKFLPTSNNTFNTNQTISYNDGVNTNTQKTINFEGTGLEPANIEIIGLENFTSIVNNQSLSECDLITCNQNEYYKSIYQNIQIKNTGGVAASSIFYLINSNYFNITNNTCGNSIAVDANCTITIRFNASNYNSTLDGTNILNNIDHKLIITYDNGAVNDIRSEAFLNGTILIEAKLKVSYNDPEILINNLDTISFGEIIYNSNNFNDITINLTNDKEFATSIYINNISLIYNLDFDNITDDFEIISSNCGNTTLVKNGGTCLINLRFNPVEDIDYTADLNYYELINLSNTNQSHIDKVKRLKKYMLSINYDIFINNTFNFYMSGYSLKPAELILTSLAYNTAIEDVASDHINYGQINRASTTYNRVTRHVNLCNKNDNSIQQYRLFETTQTSTCTYEEEIPGMPFQTFWDFDKEVNTSTTINNFYFIVKNIGASSASSFNKNNIAKFNIDTPSSLGMFSTYVHNINYIRDDNGNEHTGTFDYFFTYSNGIQASEFKYSDFSQNNLNVFGFSLKRIGASYSLDSATKELYHGYGEDNNTISFILSFSISRPVQTIPDFYKENMIDNQNIFEISNLRANNFTLASFFTDEVYEKIDADYEFINNVPLTHTLYNNVSFTISASGIKLIDENNTFCKHTSKQLARQIVYHDYNKFGYNYFSSVAPSARTLNTILRPKISFNEYNNEIDKNYCIIDNFIQGNNGTKSLTFHRGGDISQSLNIKVQDTSFIPKIIDQQNISFSNNNALEENSINITNLNYMNFDKYKITVNVLDSLNNLYQNNTLELNFSEGEFCSHLSLNKLNFNNIDYSFNNDKLGILKYYLDNSNMAYCLKDFVFIDDPNNQNFTMNLELNLEEDLNYYPDNCIINPTVNNSHVLTYSNTFYFEKISNIFNSIYLNSNNIWTYEVNNNLTPISSITYNLTNNVVNLSFIANTEDFVTYTPNVHASFSKLLVNFKINNKLITNYNNSISEEFLIIKNNHPKLYTSPNALSIGFDIDTENVTCIYQAP